MFSFPLDEGQLEDYLTSAGPTRRIFTAVERASGEPVGHAELDGIEPGRSARIARVLVAPEKRGGGIGTALTRELVRFARDELAVETITLNVYEWNAPAIASYEKVGFRKRKLHGSPPSDAWAYWSMELAPGGGERAG